MPSSSTTSTFELRRVEAQDLQEISEVELDSYPPDEAATFDQIQYRFNQAQRFFYAYFKASDAQDEIIGFVNGTLTSSPTLTHESMSNHEPTGRNLCIHSVVIHPKYRRRGYAKQMLSKYVQRICEEENDVQKMLLISKAYLLEFYINGGFHVRRLSPVVHGQDPWFELALDCQEYCKIDLAQIDAFATVPFTGNPAAVVLLSSNQYFRPGIEEWMQKVAMECNLSETAFVARKEAEQATFYLRWFTPATEVDLCGHATLATACQLYSKKLVDEKDVLSFETRSGTLKASLETSAQGEKLIALSFPVTELQDVAAEKEESLKQIVCDSLQVKASDLVSIKQAKWDLLVHLTCEAFHRIQPDFEKMKAADTRGVIVTCEAGSNDDFDFVSRFFGPNVGVNEDPVCGSAHCALTPYWASLLQKTQLRAYQASARTGELEVALEESKVSIKGRAIATIDGKISPPS